MAFQAKDGKKFSMASRMRAHNMRGDAMASRGDGGMKSNVLEAPETEGEPEETGAEDPHAVMSEHGPAMETHTEHPPEGEEGMHHVHSVHPDGHEHHSDHEDGKKAHEHAACLSGHCDHGEEESETPMGDDTAEGDGEEY